jgi:hypothetical protein
MSIYTFDLIIIMVVLVFMLISLQVLESLIRQINKNQSVLEDLVCDIHDLAKNLNRVVNLSYDINHLSTNIDEDLSKIDCNVYLLHRKLDVLTDNL